MARYESRHVKTFDGWTNQARWLARHDLTNLGFPEKYLPRTPYAYSLLQPVYTDVTGTKLYCLLETRHRHFEVWLVNRDGCDIDPDYSYDPPLLV